MVDRQFLRFCVVGTLGFFVDSAVLVALSSLAGAGPLAGRVVSFVVAATVTWHFNRRYTFRHRAKPDPGQWLRYVAVTAVGAFINVATYRLWVALAGTAPLQLVVGVALGSVLALGFNYTVSRLYLFRS